MIALNLCGSSCMASNKMSDRSRCTHSSSGLGAQSTMSSSDLNSLSSRRSSRDHWGRYFVFRKCARAAFLMTPFVGQVSTPPRPFARTNGPPQCEGKYNSTTHSALNESELASRFFRRHQGLRRKSNRTRRKDSHATVLTRRAQV
jgi:hypothetical protein